MILISKVNNFVYLKNKYYFIMVYFLQGIFLPQTHKTRSGYSLNHDVLMSGS
jgi:hypothetical protein